MKKGIKIDPVVEEWNMLSITQCKFNTIPYKRVVTYLYYLREGVFGSKLEFSEDFLRMNRIPKEVLFKRYEDSELIEVINLIPKLYTEGFIPRLAKYTKSKTLDKILYNPKSGVQSYFLVILVEKEKEEIKEKFKKYLCLFSTFVTLFNSYTEDKLLEVVFDLLELRKRVIDNIPLNIFARCLAIQSDFSFICMYVNFIKKAYTKRIYPIDLIIGSPIFNDFCLYFQGSYPNIDLKKYILEKK